MHIVIAQNVSLMKHFALSTYIRNISEFLASNGVDISVISNDWHIDDNKFNFKTYPINGNLYKIRGNLKYIYNFYKVLSKINKIKKIDIIHTIYPFSSVIGALLFKKLKNPDVKILYDIRSPWIEMSLVKKNFSIFNNIYRSIIYGIEKNIIKSIDGLIFITEGLLNYYQQFMDIKNPYIIIPSGVNISFFAQAKSENKVNLGISKNDVVFGYIGGLIKQRNIDFVIRAFNKALNHRKNIKLLIIGDGPALPELVKIAKKLNIDKYVKFTGRIPYSEIPAYLRLFDYGLCHLPDLIIYRYSFPMKILEYLASGIPVIASDIYAHKAINLKIHEGINLYSSFQDLINIFINFSKPKRLSINLSDYDWNYISLKIINFYKKLLV